jgi:uncharacterized membrane protein YedE/YeeE
MAMITPVVIGIAFGFTLERAGLGSAPKLAGQFYLRDFTVIKVMFTAVVVAMTGAFWLGRLGVIDLANVFVPETSLKLQIAGGVIFGAGFLIAGLCPGTSCVSAATGRGDGLAVMAGMFAGILAAGLVFASLFRTTSFSTLTVPQVLRLPYGIVVAAVLLGFAVAVRRAAPVLTIIALATAFAGSPYLTRYVEPRDVAAWIKERRPGLQIIDTRPAPEYALASIPLSENRPGTGDIIVRVDGRDHVLRGGIHAWTNEVVKTQHPTPTTLYFAPLRRHGC